MGRKRYGAAFRVKVLNLAEEIGYCRTSSIIGVTVRALHQWKKMPLSGESMKKETSPELKAALLEADKAKKELKLLKKENDELKTANLILKEIAAGFSKDPLNSSSGRSLNSKKKK